MMNMAPTPQQMDPKFYELAFQLAGAMVEIAANPSILAKAEQARAKEHQLTEAQVVKYQSAMGVIDKAEEAAGKLQEWETRNKMAEDANKSESARLTAAFATHDNNITALNAQQKRTNEREAKLSGRERVSELASQQNEKDRLANEKEAARLKNLAASLKKREDALMGLATTLAPKDGANGSATA